MKIIPLFIFSILSCFQWKGAEGSLLGDASKKLFHGLAQKGHQRLHAALHHLRDDLDGHLIDRFPHLNASIAKLRGNIDFCYDQTVGNASVNIFSNKMHQVAVLFFKHHGHILQNLSLSRVKKRIKIFIRNLASLAKLLVKCVKSKERGEEPMKFGLTSWAAYSNEEFQNAQGFIPEQSHVVRRKRSLSNDKSPGCSVERQPEDPAHLPSSFSWKSEGLVSPVYDQGECGTCYLFSSISSFESVYMIARQSPNRPTRFSAQKLLNCLSTDCHGRKETSVMKYFMEFGAPLDSKRSPYLAKPATCKHGDGKVVKATGWCLNFNLKEKQMKRLLMRKGPAVIGIAVDKEKDELKFLKKSIYRGGCGVKPSHAILLTGWKTIKGTKVWEIKNSWGEDWGWKGYLYIPRGEASQKCAIMKSMVVPLIAH